jgi:plasmid stabilization system protein ParE
MAKRVVWTNTAKKARKDILEYWIKRNGSNTYAKKLSKLFREKTALLASDRYMGMPTNFKDLRVSLVSHFSLFYKITSEEIIIVGVWDNRRNPGELQKNLEL